MRSLMGSLWRVIIRSSSFLRKEVFEVLRQPRLVLTLVLGPFLILLLFGVGFRDQARPLRTLFVAPQDSQLREEIETYARTLGPQLVFMGITDSERTALQRLRARQVDLVAVAPDDAYQTISNSEQAVFRLYHNEIDPFQVQYVGYFGDIYVQEVNRRVLQGIVAETQGDAERVREQVRQARDNARNLRLALEQGDEAAARRHREDLGRNLDATELALGASLALLAGVQESFGDGEEGQETVLPDLAALREQLAAMDEGEQDEASRAEEIERVRRVEEDLETLDTRLQQFRQVEPHVLVSPFGTQVASIAYANPHVAEYFAPAVIALLLQHLTVSFAALSIVGERGSGTMELLRVAPISAGETLISKYLSYLVLSGGIAAILTALVVWGLRVPMLGRWQDYALVILATLLASLGIGFAISLLAQTDTQAVQYSMIMLLAAVFFSGFFLSLESLWEPVRVVSYALPATYAIAMLQDVMLRGSLPARDLLYGLTAMAAVLFLLSWAMLRRAMLRP